MQVLSLSSTTCKCAPYRTCAQGASHNKATVHCQVLSGYSPLGHKATQRQCVSSGQKLHIYSYILASSDNINTYLTPANIQAGLAPFTRFSRINKYLTPGMYAGYNPHLLEAINSGSTIHNCPSPSQQEFTPFLSV